MRVFSVMMIFLMAIVAQADDDITGVWQTDGYGWVFDIQPEQITVYQMSSFSCMMIAQVDSFDYQPEQIHIEGVELPGAASMLGRIDLDFMLMDGRLGFSSDSITPIYADRIDALPQSCLDGVGNSPLETFDVLWHMFNENYAFFDVRGVDWQETYNTYRPQVTEENVSTITMQMLDPLNDDHVGIIGLGGVFNSAESPAWALSRGRYNLSQLILSDYLMDEPQIVADYTLLYGHLTEDIGYLNILGMSYFGEDDITTLSEVMPVILDYFADVETLVIDVRFNGGGYDTNAVYLAGYFADERRLAFTKQGWNGSEFLPAQEIYVEPVGEAQFTGEIYLLTSRLTVSAAEVFVMTMSTFPHVTTVGEATAGALSDILPVFLPDWSVATLSNELYLSADGMSYEGVGIPPTIPVTITLEDINNGIDAVLSEILSMQ